MVWLGGVPELTVFEEQQGKELVELAEVEFYSKKNHWTLTTSAKLAEWMNGVLAEGEHDSKQPLTLWQLQTSYTEAKLGNFENFLRSYEWQELRKNGLLLV